MWRDWSLREKAVSLFWFCFAAALVPLAYHDPSVHSVAGLLQMAGVLSFLVGAGLGPSMFFQSLSTLKAVPKPTMYGMACFTAFTGAGAAVELVSNVMNAF
jgi:hypothetical protein